MTAAAIELRDVAKAYPVFRRPLDGWTYLWRAFRRGRPVLAEGAPAVWALEDINLTVGKGERVGIIGRNGAGKSTLLKLLASGSPPTLGQIAVRGELHSLMPGSVSFSPELSARDNAINHLAALGLSAERIERCLEEINEFTELGEYFDQPVRSYSLGMRVRAEFAVATAHTADIVVIDEVLGAGDIYWAEKIARRMDQLCGQGTTLLLVSHSLDQIARFCERVIWIERGRVVMDGPTLDVTRRYEGFLERLSWATDDADDKTIDLQTLLPGMGSAVLPESGQTVVRWPGRGDVLVDGVWLNDHAVSEIEIERNETLNVRVAMRGQVQGACVLGCLLTFWAENGARFAVGENMPAEVSLAPGSRHVLGFSFAARQLPPGIYHLAISIFNAQGSTANERLARLDVIYKSFCVDVRGSSQIALLQPPSILTQFDFADTKRESEGSVT